MLTPYTKYASLVLILALSACSVVPSTPPEAEHTQPTQPAKPVLDVPPLKVGTQGAYEQAVELLRNGDPDQALPVFERITQSQPELAGPWVNVGVIHLGAQRSGQARAAFEQALVANPDNCDALNQLGVMARREGRFEDAEAEYLHCLASQPLYAHARLNLAILYELYMGRLGEALAAYHDYELMLDEPDVRVRGWVMDLERRVAAVAKR